MAAGDTWQRATHGSGRHMAAGDTWQRATKTCFARAPSPSAWRSVQQREAPAPHKGRGSVCRTGCFWNNRASERLFTTVKATFFHRQPWTGLQRLRRVSFDRAECFCNRAGNAPGHPGCPDTAGSPSRGPAEGAERHRRPGQRRPLQTCSPPPAPDIDFPCRSGRLPAQRAVQPPACSIRSVISAVQSRDGTGR